MLSASGPRDQGIGLRVKGSGGVDGRKSMQRMLGLQRDSVG